MMEGNIETPNTGENKTKSCGNPEYKKVALVFEIVAYVVYGVLIGLSITALKLINNSDKSIEALGFVFVIGVWVAAAALFAVIIVEYVLIKKAYGKIMARMHFFILSIIMWSTIAAVVVVTAIFFGLAVVIVYVAGGILGG